MTAPTPALPELPDGLPPAIADLPARAAAWKAYHEFADQEGFEPSNTREQRLYDRTVRFVGEAPDGRTFGIGYEWLPKDEGT